MSGGPSPAEMYDQYLGAAIFTPLSAAVLERAAPKPGERVLDLACGTGVVTRQLPPLVGDTGTVVGVDVSAAMLAIGATKEAPVGCAITWREGNGSALVELDNGSFDLVVCQQGLQFFTERDSGASEMRRVLTSDGRAVVAVWQGIEQQGMFQQLVETQAHVLHIPLEAAARPYSLGGATELEALFQDAGFETVEIVEHAVEVKLPEPAELARRTTLAVSAVMPQYTTSDLEEAAAEIHRILTPVLAHYTHDDHVVFTMKTNIAIAKR